MGNKAFVEDLAESYIRDFYESVPGEIDGIAANNAITCLVDLAGYTFDWNEEGIPELIPQPSRSIWQRLRAAVKKAKEEWDD